MIITLATIAVVGALAGRSAANTAESALSLSENYITRKSVHSIHGHTFECNTNAEYRIYKNGLDTIDCVASNICHRMQWEDSTLNVVKKAMLDGVVLWGAYGTDMRTTLLRMLSENKVDVALLRKTAEVVEDCVGSISHQEKQGLLAMYALVK